MPKIQQITSVLYYLYIILYSRSNSRKLKEKCQMFFVINYFFGRIEMYIYIVDY